MTYSWHDQGHAGRMILPRPSRKILEKVMTDDLGRSPDGSGSREPSPSVSAVPASIPSAVEVLDALHALGCRSTAVGLCEALRLAGHSVGGAQLAIQRATDRGNVVIENDLTLRTRMTDTTPSSRDAAIPEGERHGEGFLDQLRRVNTDRYHAWVGDGQDAGVLFDAAELGGEVGELLNVVKKLVREEAGWRGSRAAPEDFADECADVLICLDKLARRRGVNLAEATVAKFNATSEKVGLPHKLSLTPSPSTGQAGVERLREAIAEQITHAETRIQDGIEMGATVWRIALEDIVRENRAILAALDPLPSLSGSEVVASTTASVDIPAGMKPWSGGSRAPDDWDGGPVLFRSRQMSVESPAWRWEWGKPPHSYDVIAYTPQEDAPISGFEAREWLVSQEAQADPLPGKLLYTGQQMIAAFAAGRSARCLQDPSGQRESGEVERIAATIYAEVADDPLGDLSQCRHAVQERWYDAVRAAIDPAQQGVGE